MENLVEKNLACSMTRGRANSFPLNGSRRFWATLFPE